MTGFSWDACAMPSPQSLDLNHDDVKTDNDAVWDSDIYGSGSGNGGESGASFGLGFGAPFGNGSGDDTKVGPYQSPPQQHQQPQHQHHVASWSGAVGVVDDKNTPIVGVGQFIVCDRGCTTWDQHVAAGHTNGSEFACRSLLNQMVDGTHHNNTPATTPPTPPAGVVPSWGLFADAEVDKTTTPTQNTGFGWSPTQFSQPQQQPLQPQPPQQQQQQQQQHPSMWGFL